MPAGVFCALLVTSERTRMSVVFGRSEFACCKLVVGQHTGMYAVQQAISKRLTETLFLKALILIQLFLGCVSSFLYVLGIFAVYFLFNAAYTALEKTLFIDLPTNGYKDNAHYGFSKYSNEPFVGLMANAPSFPGTFASLRFIFSHAIYYLPLFCFCGMDAGKTYKLKGGEKV